MARGDITIEYTNHAGRTADRNIRPLKIWFGTSVWHTGQQWFCKALDLDKGKERDFAMRDIKKWDAK